MRIRLGDGYPYPFPDNLTEEQQDEINDTAAENSLTLEGVESFEWRFEMTVQFATYDAYRVAQAATGWMTWDYSKLILRAELSVADGREFSAVIVKDKAYCQLWIDNG